MHLIPITVEYTLYICRNIWFIYKINGFPPSSPLCIILCTFIMSFIVLCSGIRSYLVCGLLFRWVLLFYLSIYDVHLVQVFTKGSGFKQIVAGILLCCWLYWSSPGWLVFEVIASVLLLLSYLRLMWCCMAFFFRIVSFHFQTIRWYTVVSWTSHMLLNIRGTSHNINMTRWILSHSQRATSLYITLRVPVKHISLNSKHHFASLCQG